MAVDKVKSISINDLASILGISRGTISRAFNNKADINSKTKERILKAARQHGYRPNASARRLVSGRTDCIGILVPDLANPYLAELVTAFESGTRGIGKNAFLSITHDDVGLQIELMERMAAGQVDALIVVPYEDPSSIEQMNRLNERVPVLSLKQIDGLTCDTVMGDDQEGFRQVVNHLVELGHKRIVFLGPEEPAWTVQNRITAFERTLRQHDLEVTVPVLVKNGARPHDAVMAPALRDCLRRDNPTAIVAYDDILALHAIHALRRLQINVPKEISVTGFDNIAFARIAEIPLTTVSFDVTQLAELSMDIMQKRLQGSDRTKSIHIRVGPSLHVRSSTAEPSG